MFSYTLPIFERGLSFLRTAWTRKIGLGNHQMYDESGEPEEDSDDDYNERFDA